MKLPNTKVTVVIPTHNRKESVTRLLDRLCLQTYPLDLLEVIVVANSCSDNTFDSLKGYNAPFKFQVGETFGGGPAEPRNKGASMASGTLLIFLDDDIEPCKEFVESHVNASLTTENSVVIGYLPYVVSDPADFYQLTLRLWWEDKYSEMEKPGHRFNYTDLLSGNFSISTELYSKVGGFITGFSCRDDYELGIRLIKAGANFIFSRDAWGYHNDKVTDLNRSLKRKMAEAEIDVKISKLHPGLLTSYQQATNKGVNPFLKSLMGLMLLSYPAVSDLYAAYLRIVISVSEKMNFQSRWKRLMAKLHTYWYYRGLLKQTGNKNQLFEYLNTRPTSEMNTAQLELDLKNGIKEAAGILDQKRPACVTVKFGVYDIGKIENKVGFERVKGSHLISLLYHDFSWKLTKAFNLEKLSNPDLNPSETVLGKSSISHYSENTDRFSFVYNKVI